MVRRKANAIKKPPSESQLKRMICDAKNGKAVSISEYFNTKSEALAAIRKVETIERAKAPKERVEKKMSTSPTPNEISATVAKMEVTDPFIWKMLDYAYKLIYEQNTSGLLAIYWIDRWIKVEPKLVDHPAKPSIEGFQTLFGNDKDLKMGSESYKAIKLVYTHCVLDEVNEAHKKKSETVKKKTTSGLYYDYNGHVARNPKSVKRKPKPVSWAGYKI